MKWIDYLHSIGVNFATLEREKANVHRRDVALAYYLLTTNGNDILGSNYHNWATPPNWWPGWDIDLGRAKSKRFQDSDGIWKRKFQKGIVLAAEPGQEPTKVNLSYPMKLWQKPGTVNYVTLQGRECDISGCKWPDGVKTSEVAILLY